jgi:hypothetical protein
MTLLTKSTDLVMARHVVRAPGLLIFCSLVMTGLLLGTGIAQAGPGYQFNSDGTYNTYSASGALLSQMDCPRDKPSSGPDIRANYDAERVWDGCKGEQRALGLQIYRAFTGLNAIPSAHSSLGVNPASSGATSASSGTVPPALNASTPGLPFLGNPLVVLSYAPNSTEVADVTAEFAVGLRRQSDCSLSEDFVLPGAATPNAGLIGTLPSAEVYFHQLAGLTTTPDVFAKGCAYPILGQPSTTTALLQPTPDGGVISAELPSGLYIAVNDPVANKITTTTLLTSSANPSLGGFATAELTASGNMDIVATFATDPATQQIGTAVFLGNGDGTFKSAVYYDIAGDISIDDVNGDGIPDIVICGLTSGITTLIGKGDGTFRPSVLSATGITPCGPAPGQIVTGDFNGDGKKDLLVHDTVLLGRGDGTFTVGAPITPTATNFFDEQGNTAVGDVNNDGKLDIVVSQAGYVAVFYGNGDGTFRTGPRYAGLPGNLNPVSLADIDGDGNLDIVLGTGSGGIFAAACCGEVLEPPLFQILMGRGDGTFVDSVALNQGKYGNGEYTVAGPQIATGDFNGDGKPDVLVFSSSNTQVTSTLQMLPGNGSGALSGAVSSPVNLTPSMLVGANMNTGSRPDAVLVGLAAGSGSPQLSVLLNQGNGTFAQEQDYALPNPAVSLAVGDFNGDGRMDVAVGVAPGLGTTTGPSGVYVFFGQPNGTLALPVKIDDSLNPTGLVAADINGDGRADLVVADQGAFNPGGGGTQVNGAVHVYLGNASGSFTAAASPQTSATNYSVVAVGDLNGDGKPDLILGGNNAGLANPAPCVYTLLGNGDGTFRAGVATPLASNYGIGSTAIAVADFNEDGHLDVAVGDAAAFTSVLLGNGDGTLTPTMLALGQAPQALAAADLNGDAFPELLIGTYDVDGSGDLTVFLNQNAWPRLEVVPSYGGGQAMLPTVYIGNAVYSDMVLTVSAINSGPTGTAPESSGDVYDPSTNRLTVPAITLGAANYYNATATVAGLVSIGGVTGADVYDGTYLVISSVQVQGGSVYSEVIISVGNVIGAAGGMPKAVRDQYNPANHQLLIPAVQYAGKVYTNVTITVGSVLAVNPP